MATLYSPKIVTNGLVMYLDAGNNRSYPGSGTSWTDLSRNGITGTLTNGPTFNSANGGSIVLDGTNDYIDCADLEIFKISTTLTLEAWFRISTYVNWAGILGKSNVATGVYVMHLSPLAQKIRFSYNSSTPWNVNVIDGNSTISTNQWYHSVITSNGSVLNFYLNGALDKTQSISITFNTGAGFPVSIGQDPPGSNEFFNGRIALAKIYNRALSASEVLQNFNSMRGRYNI